jgi:membrane protease YdiL (CAAX protease family)
MISTIDRRRIFIFGAMAYGISIALGLVIFFGGGLFGDDTSGLNPRQSATILLMVLMFAPTVANIGTRLITREGWSNTLLRPNLRRGWPIYLAAVFLPILATIVGGAIYYLLFPSRFDPSMTYARDQLPTPIAGFTDPWTDIITQAAYTLLIVPSSLHLMFGEEFGWRAYLLPKLMPLGPRKAVVLVGVIWGVWHWPAILMGFNYGLGYWGAPVVGPLLFVLLLIFESAFYAWVTLRSGSVWPAAVLHRASNASNELVWLFKAVRTNPLIGPEVQGVIGMLGYAVLAMLIFFSRRALAPAAGTQSVKPGAVQAGLQPTA